MRKAFAALDFEESDEVLHPVRKLLNDVDLDSSLDDALRRLLCTWHDALNEEDKSSFLHKLRDFCGTISQRLKPEKGLKPELQEANSLIVNILYDASPDISERFPREFKSDNFPSRDDSFQPSLADCFCFWILKQREPSREWGDAWVEILRYRCPVLANIPPETLGACYSIDSNNDRQIIQSVFGAEDTTEESHQWLESFARAAAERFLIDHTGDPLAPVSLAKLVYDISNYPYIGRKEIYRKVTDLFIKEPILAESLSVEQAKVVIYCADKFANMASDEFPDLKLWSKLPESVRYALFEKLIDMNLYPRERNERGLIGGDRSVSSEMISLHDQDLKMVHNPCFWLLRPDCDLYSNNVFEELATKEDLDKILALNDIVQHRNYAPTVRDKLISAVGELQERITKMDIAVAQKVLDLTYRFDSSPVKRDDLVLVYLGRMGREAKDPNYSQFEQHFGKEYRALVENSPLEAFKRLANAIVATEMQIAKDDLSFCRDIDGLYVSQRNLPHFDEIPGTWLTVRLFEWVFDIFPGLIEQEEFTSGFPISTGGRINLTLAKVRRTWAEFCWKKLDLKKAAKSKRPEDLQPEDWIEPRPAWRIAHLKSLGDIGDDLDNKAHRRIHQIAETDPNTEVREVASEVYNKTLRERMKPADNPLYSFLKVTLWWRIANLQTMGIWKDGPTEEQEKAAIRTRNRELRLAKAVYDKIQSYYPK